MKGWKAWVKGIYDVEGIRPGLLVTGSAPEEAYERLLRFGGFPEPFLAADDTFYRRWRRTHLDVILRQDLLDLESVRDLAGIETLIEMLRERVGSPVSCAALGRGIATWRGPFSWQPAWSGTPPGSRRAAA